MLSVEYGNNMEDNKVVELARGGGGQGSYSVPIVPYTISAVECQGPSPGLPSDEIIICDLPDENRNPVTPKATDGALGDPNKPQDGRVEGQLDLREEVDSNGGSGPSVKTYQLGGHTTVSILNDADRVPRLDILWKVPVESETGLLLPQSDASVSNCHIKEMVGSTDRSKGITPRIIGGNNNYVNKSGEKEVNEALSDEIIDDKGIRVVQRKSSDEEEGGVGSCGHRDSRKNPDRPRETRETFNWPWHRGNYRLTLHFADPVFRAAFALKLLVLKTLQWVIVGVWVFGCKEIPYVVKHKENLMWTLYAATLVYVITYLSVRSTRVMERNSSSIFALVLFAMSLAHILGMIYVYFDLALIPTLVLTLIFTYATVYLLSCFYNKLLDSRSTDVGIPLTICLFIYSIVAFGLVTWIRGPFTTALISRHIGDVWFISFALGLIIATVEVIELQTVVQGGRVPLDANDWPLAATFIF